MPELVQLIPSLGFPIIACCAIGWYCREMIQSFMEREEREGERHKEEVEKFSEALRANTLVLQKLCDRLDEEREVKE